MTDLEITLAMHSIEGVWAARALVEQEGVLSLYDYTFELHVHEGELFFSDLGLFPAADNAVKAELLDDGSIHVKWQGIFPSLLELSAKMGADGRLTGMVSGEGMTGLDTVPIRLARTYEHSNPPRPDSTGKQPPHGHGKRHDLPLLSDEKNSVDRTLADIERHNATKNGLRTDALLIGNKQDLIVERYFNGYQRNIAHIASSATKSILAIIAGIAIDQRHLALHDFVWTYFPDYPTSPWVAQRYPVTVYDLLTMTANIVWESPAASASQSQELLASNDLIEFCLSLRYDDEVKRRYTYNNALPALLGLIIERAAGVPLDVYADRYLFSLLGIKHYRWTRSRSGQVMASGGLYIRPIDFLKFGQLFLRQGTWGDTQVVSEKWLDQCLTQATFPDDYPYGFYWHLPGKHQTHWSRLDVACAIGQGGQILMIDRCRQRVVVLHSSNWDSRKADRYGLRFLETLDSFISTSTDAANTK